MSEFGVHTTVHVGSLGMVVGRCYSGRLHVGSVFRRLKGRANSVAGIRFVVTRIEAYGRDFLEIDQGLTARVHLEGEGWTLVEQGSILETEDEGSPRPNGDSQEI